MPVPLTLLASLAFVGLQRLHQSGAAGAPHGAAAGDEAAGSVAGAAIQLLEHIVAHIAGSSAHEDLDELRQLVTEAFQGPTPDKNLDLERAVARAALHADLFCLMEALHEPTDKTFLDKLADRLPESIKHLRSTPVGILTSGDQSALRDIKADRLKQLDEVDTTFVPVPIKAQELRTAVEEGTDRRLTLERIGEVERQAGQSLPHRARRLFEERWFTYVSTAFAHEIKHNQVIANIYLAISVEDLHAKIETLRVKLEGGGVETLIKNQIAPSEEGFGRFSYLLAQDRFVGREVLEQDMLDAFLGAPGTPDCRGFRWHVIRGPAGVGKSRLGKQLVDHAALWPCRGFVNRDVMPEVQWHGWAPTAPTFLVADYAAEYLDQLGRMLKICATNAHTFKHPVRLLVVDRVAYLDRIESMLTSAYSTDAIVSTTRFAREPLKLTPLGKNAYLTIIKGRIAMAAGAGDGRVPPSIGDDVLERALKAVDPDCRPLWAALVGEEIGAGADISGWTAPDGADSATLRRNVMQAVVAREEQRWQTFAAQQYESRFKAKQQLQRHKNLLALATIAREVPLSGLNGAASDPSCDLPNGDAFNADLYAVMCGEVMTRNGYLSPLMPDLLGEFFVGRFYEDPVYRQRLVDLAWTLSPRGAGLFASLAQMDWRALHADPTLYLPSPSAVNQDMAPFAAIALSTIADLAAGILGTDTAERRERVLLAFNDAARAQAGKHTTTASTRTHDDAAG